MATTGRGGTYLLLLGGLALAAIMGYTLAIDGGKRAPSGGSEAAEVAVFFPDRADWLDFRLGITACGRRGLIGIVAEDPDAVTVVTPKTRRTIRFDWHRARGSVETHDEIRGLLARANPAVAVVGSINTALTTYLAEELRTAGKDGPPLLVPWATSDKAEGDAGSPARPGLLEIYPGGTFRFCLNNRREAELVVRCLGAQEPEERPGRVFIAYDPRDPYSVDLADGFRAAIRAAHPRARLVDQPDGVGLPDLEDEPGADELKWASAVWEAVRADRPGRPNWVVLPLQAEPARRMLAALKRQAPTSPPRLRVLCGDGFSLGDLAWVAADGRRPFSLWCASSGSGAVEDHEARGAQVPAEIVSALALGLDRTGPDGHLRDFLAGLNLPGTARAAIGRSLAFDRSGERKGDDLGHVLAIPADRGEVLAYTRGPKGDWKPPVALPPRTIVLARP